MKNLLQMAGCLAFIGLMTACSERTTTADYQVIPMPQQIVMADNGDFTLNSRVKILYTEGNEAMRRNADYLAMYLKKATGMDYQVAAGTEGKGCILLQLSSDTTRSESYNLRVNKEGVVITGADEAGVFYGIQTLRKSIPVEQGATPVLASVDITDAPRFGYRGVHFDVSRHFFTVEEVKTFIDMMALHNMNRLHWHLTDDQGWRIEIKKLPKLTEVGGMRKETVIGHNSGRYDGTPYGGFYTQEEAREIVKYAAERYITVIPEIDLPGHMQAALAAYPHLGCTGGPYDVWPLWGVSEDVLCAGNDDVLTFIDDVLTEIIDIFPSEYIHIGGDECPKVRWQSCPKCQARASKLGLKTDKKHTKEEYLQSFIINHAEKFLNAHNRQMIGWDETLEGGLAPNATVMSWRGEDGGIEAARQRHDVIMTPNTYLYFDYYQTENRENEPDAIGGCLPVERVYSYEPMPAVLTSEEQKHIIGVQANHWTEYIPTFSQLQYMALPRWAALCEVQWSEADKKNYENFLTRLPQLIRQYQAYGYTYAKHVFDVRSELRLNPADGTVEVQLMTMDGTPVHYTLDGTDPTENSPQVDGKIVFRQSGTLKAVAFRPEGASRIWSEDIRFSKATAKAVKANLPINKQYEFNGVTTLVDGLRGNSNFKTGRWIAFLQNDMDVTIDLGVAEEISSVAFATCVAKGDWVFDARGCRVEVSEDGEKFTQVAEESYPAMKQEDADGVHEHRLQFASPVKARYVRVMAHPENAMPTWHGGKGKPAFLFVDEISID